MKKSFVLSAIGMMSLTLMSCNKETKIETEEGNKMMDVATEETIKKVETVAAGEVISLVLNGNVKANVDMKIMNLTDSTKVHNTLVTSMDNTVKGQVCVNVTDLRKTPNPDFSNFEAYSSVSINSSMKVDNEAEEKVNETAIFYQKGATSKTKANDGDIKEEVMETAELAEMAQSIIKTIDTLKDFNKGSSDAISGIIGSEMPEGMPTISVEDINAISAKWDEFASGKITASDFMAYIQTVIPMEGMDENSLLLASSMLNIAKAANPVNYFEYTKVTNKKTTELTSTFNYASWKTALETAIDNEVKTPTAASMAIAQLQVLIMPMMPESFSYKNVVKMNADNMITGMSVEMAAKGSIVLDVVKALLPEGSISMPEVPANSGLSYDVSLSGSFDYNLSNEKITVDTL